MAKVVVKDTIHASADDVWQTISDFSDPGAYLPGVADCTTEGAGVGTVRSITRQDGTQLMEKLESLDVGQQILRYSMPKSPIPVTDYLSTMQVRDLGGQRCEVEWSATFESQGPPEAELEEMTRQLFSSGIDGLKRLHERA